MNIEKKLINQKKVDRKNSRNYIKKRMKDLKGYNEYTKPVTILVEPDDLY